MKSEIRLIFSIIFIASMLYPNPSEANAQDRPINQVEVIPTENEIQARLPRRAPPIEFVGWVNDTSRIFDYDTRILLAEKLKKLERDTGHQMVVVTISSLDGQQIEDYTRSLANRWGVGRPNRYDGVVVLIAPNERQVRIEVGIGLERKLTDDLCRQILDDNVIPIFRKGDYNRGTLAGVDTLIDNLML